VPASIYSILGPGAPIHKATKVRRFQVPKYVARYAAHISEPGTFEPSEPGLGKAVGEEADAFDGLEEVAFVEGEAEA